MRWRWRMARDVDLVGGREVAFGQGDALPMTVFKEALGNGLEEADATVVAVEAQVTDEVIRRSKRCIIDLSRDKTKTRRFCKCQLDAKVREGKRQRLSEVTVRGVTEKARTRK